MFEFDAAYFPAGTSERIAARVHVSDDGTLTAVEAASGVTLTEVPWRSIKVSSRVGSAPRKLYLPDESMLEVRDNDVIDAVERAVGGRRTHKTHGLERLSELTIVLVLVAALSAFLGFRYGIPWASDRIAFMLPTQVLELTGDQTLTLLDKTWLDETELSPEQQEEILGRFRPIETLIGQETQSIEIVFRKSRIGPNAFALPDGTIIMTDELVNLATHPDQITAVLAHEAGHVEQRHIMRSLLRSSAITLIIVMMTGDLNQVTELALGLPAFMIEMGYSREFETEADIRAAELLKAASLSPDHLADMLELLSEDCGKLCEESWISSHPETTKRVAKIRGER